MSQPGETSHNCEECGEHGVKYCRDCKMVYCQTHSIDLHKGKAFKAHKQIDVELKWLYSNPDCSEHVGQQLILFCSTCSKVICVHCTHSVLGSHSAHKVIKAEDAMKERLKQMQDSIIQIQQAGELTSKKLNEVSLTCAQVVADVVQKLKQSENALQSELKEELSNRDKALEDLKQHLLRLTEIKEPTDFLAFHETIQRDITTKGSVLRAEVLCIGAFKDTVKNCRDALDQLGQLDAKPKPQGPLVKSPKKFVWGQKGTVNLNGMVLSGGSDFASKPTFRPASRADPVVAEEKSGVQDYWEARVDRGFGGGHTAIGVMKEPLNFDVQLGAHSSHIGYRCNEYLNSPPLRGSALIYKDGDLIGLMLDCSGSPTLKGFVNRVQVFSTDIPSGTLMYPAFCVANAQLTITENPPDTSQLTFKQF